MEFAIASLKPYRAADRRGQGVGGIAPGPEVLGALEIFVGPQSYLWVKYFGAKGKIFVFLGKVPKFGMKN
jgi:hypothetical protein